MQLDVLVPNLMVGAMKVDLQQEICEEIIKRLWLLHKLRLCRKQEKTIVDKSIEYNVFCLAEHDCKTLGDGIMNAPMTKIDYTVTQYTKNL